MTGTATEPTFYDVLEVDPDVDMAAIKKAHRRLMKQYHPDVSQDPDAPAKAALANMAYGVLSDPAKREEYDRALAGPSQAEQEAAAQEAAHSFEDSWGEDWDATIPADPMDGGVQVDADEGEMVLDDDLDVVDDGRFDSVVPDMSRYSGPRWLPDPVGPAYLRSGFQGIWFLLLAAVASMLVWMASGVLTVLAGPAIAAAGSSGGLMRILWMVGPFVGWVAGIVLAIRTDEVKEVKKQPLLWAALLGGIVLASIMAMILGGWGSVALIAASFAATWVPLRYFFYARRLRKELNRIVPADTLADSNRFGGLPGGVAADQVDLALADLHKLPSVRILLCNNPDAWFSHAVVVGRRVAFVRGITGFPGVYRWSGPTLLAQDPRANFPVQVLDARGVDERLAEMRAAFHGKAEIVSFFAVLTDPDGEVGSAEPTADRPAVVSLDDIEDLVGLFLGSDNDPYLIDHEVVARTWSILNAA